MAFQDTVRWIQEEHAKVDELANKLRKEVVVIPRMNVGQWITAVRERFDHFRAHLQHHMALEEHDGYMASVVSRRPTLSVEVDRLLHEHREIGRIMDSIHRALHELTDQDRLQVRDCARRIDNLLSYVDHHEEHENMLVIYAFSQELRTHD